jgi:hypothetical protein
MYVIPTTSGTGCFVCPVDALAVSQGFENSFGKVMNYVFSQVPVEVINAIEPILDDLNNGFG